ncbi:nucleoside-binding protein [Paenibacillus uliginis N3/975]|uniref:Nucleoside-binding protein n=1 Tax=Paenibacillus uliginis N3/975 TaxID=1313296 RepID=A0A1X7HPY2_9BACL|nr:BMP family ABC transporter substrate-binding protein [Paenibacillus uliginis]SMF89673.1 nucleoside-binding protein [Paenibacillus uliginis N3/975]
MKKFGRMVLTLSLVAIMMVVAACGNDSAKPSDSNSGGGKDSGGDKMKVGYYVNATLGDKSFFDSVKRGLDEAEKALGYETKTIEGGTNQADWAAGVESMVSGKEYDVIIVGTSQMTEIVADLADRYPDQKFIFFDDKVPNKPNVYSMTYSQSEGSFLAGAFAGLVTTSTELEGANPEKTVGFVGGMDIPIVNDFKHGYEQGAKYVDPEINVVASFIGDFADAPKAKELTLAQFAQKADISYQVAAAAGLGVLEAGKEQGKYTIGVDSNQNPLYPGSVLTSMLKNLDNTTLRALEMFKDGKLPFGTVEVLGAKEGGVGLAKDDLYEKHVPQSIRDKMAEIEAKLASGEIKVESSLK